MRLVLASDLHGYLPKDIPTGDVMILAGDILPEDDVHSFVRNELNPWLQSAPVKHIIITWGNHDWAALNNEVGVYRAVVLVEEVVVIDGIKFYGSPWSLPYGKWAWMAPESTLEKIYEKIPDDVDVVVSHTPPYGICDQSSSGKLCGSRALLERLKSLQNLKLLVCGHIHEAMGRDGKVVNVSSVYNKENYCIPRIDPWTVIDI